MITAEQIVAAVAIFLQANGYKTKIPDPTDSKGYYRVQIWSNTKNDWGKIVEVHPNRIDESKLVNAGKILGTAIPMKNNGGVKDISKLDPKFAYSGDDCYATRVANLDTFVADFGATILSVAQQIV